MVSFLKKIMPQKQKAGESSGEGLSLHDAVLTAMTPALEDAGAYGPITPLVQISDAGEAFIALEVDPKHGAALEGLRQQVEENAAGVDGITRAQAVLTAQQKSQADPQAAQHKPPRQGPVALPHVKRVILIASGKGGVGKSTVTANLAHALCAQGQHVGLMDADIYGPSQPRMMGVEGQKPDGTQGHITPPAAYGIKVMSIGLMVDENAALIWRGPIVQKALMQLLFDVQWGTAEAPLDTLLIDLPPGTGDVQLTLAQKIKIDGAVIVSTPQDIALIDARRAVAMFEKTAIPVLGLIENMSTHICSQCGHEDPIFGHGGARAEADRLGVPFLGDIPLSAGIRMDSDAGKPAGTREPFADIAARLLKHS